MFAITKVEEDVRKDPRKRVFPTKPGRKREKGVQKPTVGFRAPSDIVDWLEKLSDGGADRTETIIMSLRLTREISERFADKWFEIEYRAKREKMEPGAMLAELAMRALEAENSGPAKAPKK